MISLFRLAIDSKYFQVKVFVTLKLIQSCI